MYTYKRNEDTHLLRNLYMNIHHDVIQGNQKSNVYQLLNG